MARVDFYVLSQEGPDARLRIACRLVEKAYDQNLKVYVQTSSQAEAQRLDELLWTFNDRAFIPHEINTGNGASHERVVVLIGEAAAPQSHRQLLINLVNRLPDDFEHFERVAEIVDVDPENKRLSRERYKVYRERGCELDTHNL
ncbi:MAG TPA: DNA polymerase III subunit chi [Povalibacter sp.]|uniref:DNA polymerase III subunit chi n=1 Tax=Povalibacter sp. TaxID=1962978 RepID=UPI002C5A0D51|nr:DNA polymerase III subunit chi [Povalibacter sp.]HMN43448.1 DNA polymerase III subunit chi [Povalibacter sp.]